MFSSGKFPLFFTELVGADPVAKCGLRAQTKGAVTAKYEAWQDFVLSDSSVVPALQSLTRQGARHPQE